jgi:hypothetical protein
MSRRRISLVCAWCGARIRDVADTPFVSHGICPSCVLRLRETYGLEPPERPATQDA